MRNTIELEINYNLPNSYKEQDLRYGCSWRSEQMELGVVRGLRGQMHCLSRVDAFLAIHKIFHFSMKYDISSSVNNSFNA
jgi:hypothetical protein